LRAAGFAIGAESTPPAAQVNPPEAPAATNRPGAEPGLIDRVRDFWNGRPCNIRHSPRPVGSREYFDEVEARRYFVEYHIPDFAQFGSWAGKRVLEIGCGIGSDTVSFARAGAQVTAVELSEASLNVCKQRFAVYGLEASLYSGNAEDLGDFVPVREYDLIYSFGVIHHSPSPEQIVAQLKQYAGPETEIRVMLYSKWSWKVLWILLKYGHGAFWKLPELIARHSEAETGCPVTFTYSGRDVRRLFREFEILELRKAHIFPYEIDRYVQYEYVKVWYFRFLPGPLFRWLERRIGWHTLITARLRDNA